MANALNMGYMAPAYSGRFGYPNLDAALNETDDEARIAMHGPQLGQWRNRQAESDRALEREIEAARAYEQAVPGQIANALAYQTPIVGNALSARDAVESAQNRDWLGVALGAAGAIPLLANMKGIARGLPAHLPRSTSEVKVYHGTPNVFDRFRDKGEHYFSESPDIAENYTFGAKNIERRSEPNIMPAFLNTENFKSVDFGGSDFGRLPKAINAAREEGYHGIIAKNIGDIGGTQTQYVTWTPGTVRSALSDNQLYNLAPLALGGMALSTLGDGER